jgi:hypothetical protein
MANVIFVAICDTFNDLSEKIFCLNLWDGFSFS